MFPLRDVTDATTTSCYFVGEDYQIQGRKKAQVKLWLASDFGVPFRVRSPCRIGK